MLKNLTNHIRSAMTYLHKTQAGTFFIKQKGNRWHVIYQDDSLGRSHAATCP